MHHRRLAFFLMLLWPLHAEDAMRTVVLPVAIHLVRSTTHPRLHAQISEAEVRAVLQETNAIWSQANVRFELRGADEISALDLPSKKWFQRDRNWVKAALPTTHFHPAAIDVCFVHDMGPNGFFYGEPVVVCETPEYTKVRGGAARPVARVLAHELGHVLFLKHRQDHTNLMASGRNGVTLNREEIATARKRALQLAAQLTGG